MTEKTCTKCGETKDVSLFAWRYGTKRSKPGYKRLRPHCKACGSRQGIEWSRTHRSTVLVYSKRNRQKRKGNDLTPLVKHLKLGEGAGKDLPVVTRYTAQDWHCVDCGVPCPRAGRCGNCSYARGVQREITPPERNEPNVASLV